MEVIRPSPLSQLGRSKITARSLRLITVFTKKAQLINLRTKSESKFLNLAINLRACIFQTLLKLNAATLFFLQEIFFWTSVTIVICDITVTSLCSLELEGWTLQPAGMVMYRMRRNRKQLLLSI